MHTPKIKPYEKINMKKVLLNSNCTVLRAVIASSNQSAALHMLHIFFSAIHCYVNKEKLSMPHFLLI